MLQVILSGGSTKLICVSKKVQDFFSNAEVFSTIPADEVITVGAAKQVCTLSHELLSLLSELCSLPLVLQNQLLHI